MCGDSRDQRITLWVSVSGLCQAGIAYHIYACGVREVRSTSGRGRHGQMGLESLVGLFYSRPEKRD